MSHLILVAEDDPLLRLLLADLFTDEGYRVTAVADGQEALDMIVGEPPDLIVSDVAMPRVGGVELVRRLRSGGAAIPVVLISAHSARVDLPGVRFLRKPFDIERLMAEVSDTLTV